MIYTYTFTTVQNFTTHSSETTSQPGLGAPYHAEPRMSFVPSFVPRSRRVERVAFPVDESLLKRTGMATVPPAVSMRRIPFPTFWIQWIRPR